MKQLATAIAFAIGLAATGGAQVVDQQQLNSTTSVSTDDRLYQSFVPTYSNIVGVSVNVFAAVLPYQPAVQHDASFVFLYDAMPWDPTNDGVANVNAHLIGSAWAPYSITPGQSAWVDIFFNDAIALTPGHLYFLGFGGVGHDSFTDDGIGLQPGDDYPLGAAYSAAENPNRVHALNGDLAFKEYAAIVTPEPASLVLVGTGLLLLGGRRRRSN